MAAQDFKKAILHLKRSDHILASMIQKVGECTLVPREGHYGSLLRSIISQQISVSAARTIHDRFLQKVGSFHPERILKMKDDELRAIGLSPQKMSYIRDLSIKIHKKEIDLKDIHLLDDELIIEQLVKIKGIGRWTAEMFLIFSLNRPDVFPCDDLGVKSVMMKMYGFRKLPSIEKMIKIASAWAPYRTIGTWYLWQYSNQGHLKKDAEKPKKR